MTEGLYLISSVIIEGQYYAGYCSQHLDDATFKELQPLEGLDFGEANWPREVVELGKAQLRDGIRDAAAKPPSEELCARVLTSFFKDQRDVLRYARALPAD